MIRFEQYTLENGLKVILHNDMSTPLVAINMMYDVGSKDDPMQMTGMAHMLEHLMFTGSENIVNYDHLLQSAGGENNAFTNSDVTNYYSILPSKNIESGLFAEADRMLGLTFDEAEFHVQQKVIVEEYYETCINEPFGDVWHHLLSMAYIDHPYAWPTIGKELKHIKAMNAPAVRKFYQRFYHPKNATLVLAGNFEKEQTKDLIENYFSGITGLNSSSIIPQQEYVFPGRTQVQLKSPVDIDMIFLAFPISERIEESFYSADLITDVLANGPSSRLYRNLHKEKEVFSSIDAYVTGSIGPGLLIVEGKLAEGVDLNDAQLSVWDELNKLVNKPISDTELRKWLNKKESSIEFSETSIVNNAFNLAFFNRIGDITMINTEIDRYSRLDPADIQNEAAKLFNPGNCITVLYKH